jgi:hypothetical protein
MRHGSLDRAAIDHLQGFGPNMANIKLNQRTTGTGCDRATSFKGIRLEARCFPGDAAQFAAMQAKIGQFTV